MLALWCMFKFERSAIRTVMTKRLWWWQWRRNYWCWCQCDRVSYFPPWGLTWGECSQHFCQKTRSKTTNILLQTQKLFFLKDFFSADHWFKINAKKGFLRERGLNFQALPSLEVSLVDPARGETISLLFGPHLNYFPWLSFAPWFCLFLLLSPL